MTRLTFTRALLTVGVAATSLALVACDTAPTSPTSPTAATQAEKLPRSDAKGGTVRALTLGPIPTWDPQRIATREDMALAGRLFARTLTAYAPNPDPTRQDRLVGDLATDTGKASKDLRTWTFTLRQGVAWEDGSAVTCADVKYGISRTFATKEITGGPAYALAALDVPKRPDGTSAYAGPYDTSAGAAAGRRAFDAAVTCDGSRLTLRLATPMADFNEMVTLPAFGPYRKEADKKRDSTFTVQSSGPYVLKGPWNGKTGGTFVRNPQWKAASDPVRPALADQIVLVQGVDTPTAVQQITSDEGEGRSAISLNSAPPALQQQITAATALSLRTINPRTGLVDYLVPNFRSPSMKRVEVRRAFALATDRAAYVNALGGPTAAEEATSLIPAPIRVGRGTPITAPSTTPVPSGQGSASSTTASPSSTSGATSASPTPDGNAAKAALAKAGITSPVKITVAYRQGETADKAMAALVAGWKAGGFDVTLRPIGEEYFTTIAAPASRGIDVFWSNWAPEWASASTVLPPLFDARINLAGDSGSGRDYGYYSDDRFNSETERINAIADRADREKAWAALDDGLLRDGVYVGLAQRRAMYVSGSAVRNFSGNEILGGYVELADIGIG